MIIILRFLLLTCISLIQSSALPRKRLEDWQNKQLLISRAINESLARYSSTAPDDESAPLQPLLERDKSAMHSACHSLRGRTGDFARVGCCQPQDVRVLYNVMVDVGALAFFGDGAYSALPSIRLVHRHGEAPILFSLPIRRKSHASYAQHCPEGAFDGTLHVFGRSITHNVYHTTVDNFLPIAAQIAQDAYLRSPFLHRPRVFLSNLNAGPDAILNSSASSTPHTQLVRDLFSAGSATLTELQGICFARVVWNAGIRALYHNTLVTMRRSVGDFARAFVLAMYQLRPPDMFFQSSRVSQGAGEAKGGLRIVIYTRGSSGQGRSLANEAGLVQSLARLGHHAAICCHGAATIYEQIGFAAYADVVVGMHGAALVHAIFSPRGIHVVELKGGYGYTSSLFALVTDSRSGIHSHIDIRDYQLQAGYRPIDDALSNRVAMQLQLARPGVLTRSVIPTLAGGGGMNCTLDATVLPSASTGPLQHFLGPAIAAVSRICQGMEIYRYQTSFGAKSDELHCAHVCVAFVA